MGKDILVVCIFVISVVLICLIWNAQMLKRYKLSRQSSMVMTFTLSGQYNEKLVLAGITEDDNSDYRFEEVIKKINLPDDVGVTIYD